jgi:sodium-coupled monocarboxylate transporter 8/12
MNGYNQGLVQRFLSLKDLKSAKRACVIYIIGVFIIMLFCCYNGLLIFASYHDCDPLQTGLAKIKDQLLPLFVMDKFKDFPGLPGFFIAGIFSAALSTISTILNSVAAVLLKDFIIKYSKRTFSERETAIILRSSIIIFGLIAALIVIGIKHLSTNLMQLSISVLASCYGPLLGIFFMGKFLPSINARV